MTAMVKNQFVQLLKNSRKGAIVGVIIAILYMLSSFGLQFNPTAVFYFLLFGLLVGFLIAFTLSAADRLIVRVFAFSEQYIIIPQSLSIFVISSTVFLGSAYIFNRLYLGYFPSPSTIISASIWTGIAAVIAFLIMNYLEEREEKKRLEYSSDRLAVIEERRRIARELHDSVSQILFGVSLNLQTLEYLLDIDYNKARLVTKNLQEMVQDAQTEMRLMIHELQPAELDGQGFFEAIENLVKIFRTRFNIDIKYHSVGPDSSIENRVQLKLYKVLQEALSNTVRHAEATLVTVTVTVRAGGVQMIIQDNGRGFVLNEVKGEGHYGIKGMYDQIKQIGGNLVIESSPNSGTRIQVTV